MLRVTLIGNLGSDPDSRFTQDGKEVVELRVAVNQSKKRPGSDEREEWTNWFRVSIWQGSFLQDMVKQRCTKGTRVLIAGRLEIGSYQDREGVTKTTLDVRPDEIQVLDRGRTDNGEGAPQQQQQQQRAPQQQPRGNSGRRGPAAEPEALEDLPF